MAYCRSILFFDAGPVGSHFVGSLWVFAWPCCVAARRSLATSSSRTTPVGRPRTFMLTARMAKSSSASRTRSLTASQTWFGTTVKMTPPTSPASSRTCTGGPRHDSLIASLATCFHSHFIAAGPVCCVPNINKRSDPCLPVPARACPCHDYVTRVLRADWRTCCTVLRRHISVPDAQTSVP